MEWKEYGPQAIPMGIMHATNNDLILNADPSGAWAVWAPKLMTKAVCGTAPNLEEAKACAERASELIEPPTSPQA
jgi:hypothetical protein